jgi:hypothetical protein
MAEPSEPSGPEPNFPTCFDPYLRYAIATDFKNFELSDEKRRSVKLFFLVEFKEAGQDREFTSEMEKAEFPVVLGPADDNVRYATLYTDKRAVVKAVGGSVLFDIWERYVSRLELSLPLQPSGPVAFIRRLVNRSVKDHEASLLIGVLDDGCPFAAAHFLRVLPGPAANTRVRSIWDQNQGKDPVEVNDSSNKPCLFGQELIDFNYGLEFWRESEAPVPAPMLRQVGLDEWIGLHSTSTGSIDEDGCYRDAGFTSLSRRQSHGAHIMDIIAGRVPTSSRVGPSPPGDRRDPPSWQPETDAASAAEVVFVQFPDDCIRDATGVWLKAYVLDGIRYILSFADPSKTENVIINISYGPTTGPHDGTALLEEALTALVAEFDGITKKPKLTITLAAGNAYLSEGHVVFEGDKNQPTDVEWTWRLPPDNTVLCFAEVWLTNADAVGVTVTLTSPSGVTLPLPAVPTPQVGGPFVQGSHTMWRLEVGPTIAPGPVGNEHGDWKITAYGIRKGAVLHAYVARSDPNMGVRTGARRSYFVDHTWELTRSSEASCKYADGEFDKTGSLIRCGGTLNGIATAKVSGVHVAGGYNLATGRKSPYSSAGPARSGPLILRIGPDYMLPCDESYALTGIRAGGNRSGSVFRLMGTSAAAPQFARHLADPPIPPATNPPMLPGDIAKRGGGNIEPP